MKVITYQYLSAAADKGPHFIGKTVPYSAESEEAAKREAYNGEYTIEDDGVEEEPTPSQLDIIEAQVTYTAMMTDTLLEV